MDSKKKIKVVKNLIQTAQDAKGGPGTEAGGTKMKVKISGNPKQVMKGLSGLMGGQSMYGQ